MTGVTPPYALANMLPASKPPRPRWVVPLVVFLVVAALILAGLAVVTVRGLVRRSAVVTATTPVATTPGGLRDPDALKACAEIAQADTADLDLMLKIGGDAALAAIFDVHVAGALLQDNVRLASAAAGQPDGPALRGRVATAAKSLRDTCVRTGYLSA